MATTEGGPPPPDSTPAEVPLEPPADLFRLDGRRVLLVGGYGGIGTVTGQLFADQGAAVAVAGRSLERAEEAAAALRGRGATAAAVRLDLADRESVDAGVASARDSLGGLDAVVNLASAESAMPAETLEESEFERLLDINLTGAFRLSQAAGRLMIESGTPGRIIHFSSTRSIQGGRRGFAGYAASKGGLNMLVRQLATEWARFGITVNGVAPGFVPTGFVQGTDDRFLTALRQRTPMGRFGAPWEMASAAVFLAGPGASFITGQIVFVDGGVTASS